MTEIMIATIPAICSIIAAVITCNVTIKINMAVLQEQIKELTKRVEKHNQLVERTYKLEADVENLKNRL